MQFIRPFTFHVVKLLLQAMENRLIDRLGLAIGLKVCNSSETSLATQVVEIVHEFTGVELPAIVEIYGARNAQAGDNVSSNKLLYFSSGCRGYSLDPYPFGEVVHLHKKVLTLPCSLGERAEDIHFPCGKQQRTDNWHYGGGGDSLDRCELLAFVTGPH